MTPDTLHLLATMLRHSRGIATSVEKWVRKQPPSPTCRELLQLLAEGRGVLTSFESQLTQFDIRLDADEDETGAEVEQPTRADAGRLSSPHHLTQVK